MTAPTSVRRPAPLAVLAGPCVLALELAAATSYDAPAWQNAIVGAGGETRAAWLVEYVGIATSRLTPDALIVAHVTALLLELGPPTAPAPP